MSLCQIHSGIAYLGAAYIIASLIYLVVSQSYGTPFKNALSNYPQLMQIKKESATKRKRLFYTGMVIAGVLLYFMKPFKSC